MDKNTLIGFTLIAAILGVYVWMSRPDQAQIERYKAQQDSLARVAREDSLKKVVPVDNSTANSTTASPTPTQDSALKAKYSQRFGAFAEAAIGSNQVVSLENSVFKIDFNTKGGRIAKVALKNYLGYRHDSIEVEGQKTPLLLMEDTDNKFEYLLPVGSGISTEELVFKVAASDSKSLTLRADAGNGRYFEQKYSIGDGYTVDYQVTANGMNEVFSGATSNYKLLWLNHLSKIEHYDGYEQTVSYIYHKQLDESADYMTKGEKTFEGKNQWVSHAQQFFNMTLMAKSAPFESASGKVIAEAKSPSDLKVLASEFTIPFNKAPSETFAMQMYLGPNDFTTLTSFNNGLEEVIPYGWSIFGTLNRWVVRPMFNFLHGIIPSLGLCILLLTLIVKLLLYPLQHKMILSSVKMSVLRPQIAKLREKYGADQQKISTEQMKLFQEYGVNPLGGCLPALLQSPIWIALYRFFPSSLPFRQESFLWAKDLVSYDEVLRVGSYHLSLFTLLWVISMIVFAWYNSKLMDTGMQQDNPMMKYMPYIFPIFFFFVLNSSASGLTLYMMFSNLLNIGFTIFIKNVVINEDKIREQLEVNKTLPKKQGRFQKLMEETMKKQQEIENQKKKNQ